MPDDANRNKLADKTPQGPSMDEMAQEMSRNWFNSLGGRTGMFAQPMMRPQEDEQFAAPMDPRRWRRRAIDV
jgi:hypothetical protein